MFFCCRVKKMKPPNYHCLVCWVAPEDCNHAAVCQKAKRKIYHSGPVGPKWKTDLDSHSLARLHS